MTDFLKTVIESAKEAFIEVTDKVQSKLDEIASVDDVVEYDVTSSLEDEISALTEELEEAQLAIKLLLDGETNKTFLVPTTKADALDAYIVETYWPASELAKFVVKQRKL